ncbi:MAG TPA: polysaccharide biosynthesis tyrosine autokinase [Azospirillaceae bacterium]|nr:polysaccharide biosynthesis tyrosine autokinase [Azospirillaceae bacterium]
MGSEDVVQFREGRAQRLARILEEQQQVSLRDQLLKLKRRRWVILGTMLALTLLTAIMLERAIPLYTATTTVMIDPPKERTLDIEGVVSGLPADVEAIQGEIAIIKSRGLAAKVIDKLELDKRSEFNPTMWQKSWFDPVGWLQSGVGAVVGLFADAPAPVSTGNPDAELKNRIITVFLNKLEAQPRGRSRVIEITFTSADNQLAAKIVNTVAEVYITDQLDAKFEATERATRWLNERVTALREETEAAEKAVEAFRGKAGLLQGEGSTLAAQELSRLNAELIIMRSSTAEAEARLRAAEGARGTGNASSLPMAVLQNGLIQSLQGQQVELNRRLAEAGETFGPKHPTMINLKAEMAALQSRIQAEVGKVVSGLRNDLTIARQREASVTAELNRLKNQSGRGEDLVQLKSLENEANSRRMLLTTLMQRFNETNLQQDLQQADARIISPAPVPQRPASPNKPLLLGLALFLSAVLGVIIAFILEQLDQGFRSGEQLSAVTGISSLGMVPAITPQQRRELSPEDFFLRKPRSSFGESVSSAVASLFLTSGEKRPRSIMVTSSLPNEGKSTMSVNLARAVSQSGLRTLLIDGDLRRPTLHTLLGMPMTPGLTEYLQGKATIEEIVRRDPKSGVDFIAAGGQVSNPLHFLAADKTRAFIHGLSKHYDFVVVDSSPVMVVSDSRIMSRYVDETVFVVRWARTRREHVIHSLKQLVEAGASVGGVLLSMVNTKRHADYSFGDSGQYHLGNKYYES